MAMNHAIFNHLSRRLFPRCNTLSLRTFCCKSNKLKDIEIIQNSLTNVTRNVLSVQRCCAYSAAMNLPNESTSQKPATVRTKKINNNNVLQPALSQDEIQDIKNVVSLNVGSTHITWAKLDETFTIHSWNYIPMSFEEKHIHNLYLLAKDCHSKLPPADLYIMETYNSPVKHLSYVPYILVRSSLQAMIFCLVNEDKAPKFVTMRSSTVANLFGLLIGKERVSAKNVVNSLLDGTSQGFQQVVGNSDILKKYWKSDAICQEHMGNVLLACVAFFKLFKPNKS